MRYEIDMYGHMVPVHDIAGMLDPRQCGICGHVHDSAKQATAARYTDCDMWRCPKCNGLQDNRDFLNGPGQAKSLRR